MLFATNPWRYKFRGFSPLELLAGMIPWMSTPTDVKPVRLLANFKLWVQT